jgi:hypothetical protein
MATTKPMNKYSAVDPHDQLTPEQSQFARKVAAARAASKLSTGPRSEEGKAIASKNAVKHGFAGAVMVIDDEDKEAYELHLDAYHQTFQPVSQPECDAVRLAANAMWRIDRLTSIETGLFELEASFHAPHVDAMLDTDKLHHYYAIAFKEQIGDSNPIDLCRRYLSSAQRDFHRAIVTFNLLRASRVTSAAETAPKLIHIVPKPQQNQQEPNELTLAKPQQPKIYNFIKGSRKFRREQKKLRR